MKGLIRKIPFIGRWVYRKTYPKKPFPGSKKYWIARYERGRNSGEGSYSNFAEFKAEVINKFVQENNIRSVIELGCGDGNQLTLAKYPNYIGFDVSPKAISICESLFSSDPAKKFFLMDDYAGQTAELTMSLDVIYHLTEDAVFESYMALLFNSSSRFSIIYSSNKDENLPNGAPHVKHRKFTDWVERNRPDWNILMHIPNKYPWKESSGTGSFADFYIFQKANPTSAH